MSPCDALFHFQAIIWRQTDPQVTVMHSSFFNGRVLHPQGEGGSPIRLEKNIYNLAPVFFPDGELVCEASIGEHLSTIATVELLPVVFDRCYEFPYRLGNRDYEDYPAFDLSSDLGRVLHQFARKYKARSLPTDYVCVRPMCGREIGSAEWAEAPRVVLSGYEDEGITEVELACFLHLIAQRGLLFQYGYQASSPVMEFLRPHLDPHFVWVKQLTAL